MRCITDRARVLYGGKGHNFLKAGLHKSEIKSGASGFRRISMSPKAPGKAPGDLDTRAEGHSNYGRQPHTPRKTSLAG